MSGFWDTISQCYPPKPRFTENNIPDLSGKVFIVTGSSSGVGKQLARLLYTKNAKVYLACRSPTRAHSAIQEIQDVSSTTNRGELHFLHLDLADLSTIRASAESFLSKEGRLDILFNNAGNNAGVWNTPFKPKTAQGYEMQLGLNCIGHSLFTKFLTAILADTAKRELQGASKAISLGGYDLSNLDFKKDNKGSLFRYSCSKAGLYLLAVEFAKRYEQDGVVSIALNPGFNDNDMTKDLSPWINFLLRWLLVYSPVHGAWTELFAGFSEEITVGSGVRGSWNKLPK